MPDTAANPPVIGSPLAAWGAQNRPFAFAVPVLQGAVPMVFSAAGLPAGLAIDPLSGVITGIPLAAGSFVAALTVANNSGSAAASLTIRIGAWAFDLAAVKQYLQIGSTAADALLQLLVDSAQEWAEQRLNLLLHNQFCEDWCDGGEIFLNLSKHPVNAVALVTDSWDWDAAGDNTVYPAKLVGERVQRADTFGRALFGYIWIPGVKRWHVQYTAGCGLVPPGLMLALLQLIARAWQQRAGEASGSAAGAAVKWEALAGSDLMHLLMNYSHRRVAAAAEKANQ